MRYVELLIETGPAPLSQLARRAKNSKTGTAMLQNAAHYLGEASAALAAAYWLGRNAKRTDAIDTHLAPIYSRGASFGATIGVLRESSGNNEALVRPFDDPAPADALISALAGADELGELRDKLRSSLIQARSRGALGLLEFLVTFRNKVFAHGAMLPESTARMLARPLLEVVAQAVGSPALFEGAWLGRTGVDLLSEDERRFWKKLHGHSEATVEDKSSAPNPNEVDPRYLYFVGPRGPVSLSFWVVQDEDATGLSRFGFFSKGIGKFKGIEYLNYLAGPFRYDALVGELEEAAVRRAVEAIAPEEAPKNTDERRLGDFVIESELGRGAMGIVYLATQASLGRKVALKVLPPVLLDDPVALGRFNREIRGLGRCDHPNVVRVLTSGVDEGRPYYAMELVDGADLSLVFDTLARWKKDTAELDAAHLGAASSSRRRRPLGLEDVPQAEVPTPALSVLERRGDLYTELARLFAAAADGVEEVHSRGLLHRDLKPANLMLTADGERLVVMDLGLAKLEDASMGYTRDSGTDFVGSARYAAPEQIQARLMKVDHRADIYSLGATLYELATLTTLYPAESVAELLQQKLNADPTPPRDVERRVPKDLDTIIQRAMARQAEARYNSAAELSADLSAFAQGRPISARPPSPYDYLRLFYRRQRVAVQLAAAAIAVVLAVVAGSFVVVSKDRTEAIFARNRARIDQARATAREKEAKTHLASFLIERARRAEERRDWRHAAGFFAAARMNEDTPRAAAGQALAEARAIQPITSVKLEGPVLASSDARIAVGRRVAYELDANGEARRAYELPEELGFPRALATYRGYLVAPLGDQLWFGESGRGLQSFDRPGARPTAIALSADELSIAIADEAGNVFVANLEQTPLAWKLAGSKLGSIARLIFLADGSLAAAGSEGRVFRVAQPNALLRTTGGSVRALAASPIWPELLISAGDDDAVRFHYTKRGSQLHELAGAARALSISADGRWLAVGAYDAELIDLDTLDVAARVPTRGISAIAASNDTLLAASDDEARWYRIPPGLAPLVRLAAPELAPIEAVFSRDGAVVAAAGGGRVAAFRARDGAKLFEAKMESGPIALSRDGAFLAAGSAIHSISGAGAGVPSGKIPIEGASSLAFSPADGSLAVATSAGEVSIWDLTIPTRKQHLRTRDDPTRFDGDLAIAVESKLHVPNAGLAFSPDGARLAAVTGGRRKVTIWDAAGGKQLVELAFERAIKAIAFSPDGTAFAILDYAGHFDVYDSTGRAIYARDGDASAIAFLESDVLAACDSNLHLFAISRRTELAGVHFGFDCLAISSAGAIAGSYGPGRSFVRTIVRPQASEPRALLKALSLELHGGELTTTTSTRTDK